MDSHILPAKYRLGGGWGNAIQWMQIAENIVGWKTPLPKDGDFVLATMLSGQTGRYKIKNLKPCGNPPDMFFADVEFDGYEDK